MHKHFSDAELLQHLDGELRQFRRWRVQLHLFRCWECRARKAALEAQAHRFAEALRADTFPGAARVSAARAEFENRRWALELPAARAAGRQMPTWKVAAGCCGLVIVGMAGTAGYHKFQTVPAAPGAAVPTTAVRPNLPETAAIPAPRPAISRPLAALPRRAKTRSAAVAAVNKPDTVDLDLVEADVHYRLHRIGACAGEPILIARRDKHSLSVTAVGPPQHRSREIREALDDLGQRGLVHFETTGDDAEPLPSEALGDAGKIGQPSPLLLHSPLARRFASQPEFARRSGAALRLAESIYAQAWALQRHANLPVPDRSHRSPARWLAEAMHRDHTAQIQTLVDRLEKEVTPLLPPAAAQPCSQQSATAFEAATQIAALTHRLFTPSTAEELAATEADSERLATALVALRCAIR